MKTRFVALAVACFVAAGPLFGLTVREIRNNNRTRGRAEQIQSARLVYRITSDAMPDSTLLVRAQRPNQFRLDFYSGKESRAICITPQGGWSRTSDLQVQPLSEADVAEVEYDAAFLPFPILDRRIYEEPVSSQTETVDGILCTRFDTKSLKDEDFKITLWVDEQSDSPHLYKMEANDHGKMTIAVFSDYREVNGVLMPGTIQLSHDDGFSTMKLRTAQWNLTMDPNVFVCPTGNPGRTWPSGVTAEDRAARAKGLTPISDQEAQKIQQEIADLDVRINALNDVLNRLDQGMRDNQAYEVQLAHAERSSRFYYSYYRHSSWVRHRDRNRRRRAMRDMSHASKKMAKDYDNAQKELVELQLKRGRLKNRLKAAGRE